MRRRNDRYTAVPSGLGGDPNAVAAQRLSELRVLAASWGFPLAALDRLTLRLDEVASITGLSVSLVRALIQDGDLPTVKVRSVPLVRTTDLLVFLESRVSAPEAVADQIANELAASLERQGV